MNIMQKNQYTPLFTPRFHLSDATMIGIEVQIKQAQRILSAHETFRLIQSGNSGHLLEQINVHLAQWCKKAKKPMYLSWQLGGQTNPADWRRFWQELGLYLPLGQLEIVLDAQDLTTNAAFEMSWMLFKSLPDTRIRRGLFHPRPFEFNLDDIRGGIDLLKLKKGAIRAIKEGMSSASQCHSFIERLNGENIAIVADDLYSKSDVTYAMLMGIRYGQGYFLSRNQTPQKSIKTLKNKPGSDLYLRRFDCLNDTAWI